MKNAVLKGSILIALGASCYGMLGTFVKMAYQQGYSIAEVTLSQFILGFLGLLVLTFLRKKTTKAQPAPSDRKGILKLVAAGTSLGLTSIFYYMAVRYIPVSVAIVLLMQTVWMGVVLEMIRHKKAPGIKKILAVLAVLGGTALATNIFGESSGINWTGVAWGILSALTYTATMYTSNHLEVHFPPLTRSLSMITGGLLIIICIFHNALFQQFSFSIFLGWGLVVSLFGTILPPLLFTRGMPLTGIGLGAIIAALEIPVSVLMASLLLKEQISFLQWMGVLFILLAVVLMNFWVKPLKNTSL